METENAACPNFYPGLRLKVSAPGWYFKGHEADDEYSQKILSSKTNDESNYFIPKIKELIDSLIKRNEPQKICLVITIPKSDLEYSITLNSIAKWIKTYLGIEYENIIERVSKGRRNLGGNASEKRFNQTNSSMKLKRSLKPDEKNILILDDVKATGMTLLESAKILKGAGAENISCICLGINRNLEKFPIKK